MIQRAFVVYWSNVYFFTAGALLVVTRYRGLLPRLSGSFVSRFIGMKSNWLIVPRLVIGLALIHFFLYILVPNYADFVEPLIPVLASNYLHGGLVYADWHCANAVVGSFYGPYIFLTQAIFLSLTPSILASKLAGIFFAVVAIGLFFLSIRPSLSSHQASLIICATMISLFAFQLHYWFWDRPDPVLTAVVALSVLIYDRTRPERCLVFLGLLAGIATNLKAFGAIYLCPIAAACLVATGLSSRLFLAMAIAGIAFAVTLAAPFAIGSFSLRAYVSNLLVAGHQGIEVPVVIACMFYGISILAPLLLALRRSHVDRAQQAMVVTLVACTVLVAVVAGKPGGGPPYLMPLVPLSLYLAVRLWHQCPQRWHDEAIQSQHLVLGVTAVCVLPIWAYSFYQIGKQLPVLRTEYEKSAELRQLFQDFPNAEMGHGRLADEYYRVQKAFLGQVTRFDYINYTDQRLAGLPSAILYPLLLNCSVPYWIFSKGGGRFVGNGFFGQPLFDDGVRSRFYANYNLVHESRHYEVWSCNAAGEAPPNSTGHSAQP